MFEIIHCLYKQQLFIFAFWYLISTHTVRSRVWLKSHLTLRSSIQKGLIYDLHGDCFRPTNTITCSKMNLTNNISKSWLLSFKLVMLLISLLVNYSPWTALCWCLDTARWPNSTHQIDLPNLTLIYFLIGCQSKVLLLRIGHYFFSNAREMTGFQFSNGGRKCIRQILESYQSENGLR